MRSPTTDAGEKTPRSRGGLARRVVGQVLPRLVRPAPRRVCFASVPDFGDSAFAQYRHLLETRTDLEFVWLLHDRTMRHRVEAHFRRRAGDRGHTLRVVDWNRPTAYLAYLRASVVFHTHGAFNFSPSVGGRREVSLWHGMPLKVIGLLEEQGPWQHDVSGDLHLATSRMFQYVVAAAFGVGVDRVVVSGLPRTDVLKGLASPEHDKSAICAALDIDRRRELVVWLPTHRTDGPAGPSRSFLDDVDPTLLASLLDACAAKDCQLVVKPHPLDALADGAIEGLARHPALTVVPLDRWKSSEIELYDVLAAAGGLITDISSVLVDFLHTGRPMATFGFDEAAYERRTVVPLAPLSQCAALGDLTDRASVDRFVTRVARAERVELPDDDIARWLIEDTDIGSSEVVARAAGL